MNRVYELSGRPRPRLPLQHGTRDATIHISPRASKYSFKRHAMIGLADHNETSLCVDTVQMNRQVDMSSMSETELKIIFQAAKTGQLKPGFTDWYIFREKCRDSDGSVLPNLWVNPRRMFFGTLYQAYRFVDPHGVGPAIVTTTRKDDLSGILYEVRVDAITGQEQADTVSVPKVSLTWEEFDSSLQDY